MPASVNQAFLLGNVGRDMEVRHTPNGVPHGSFTMATTRHWKKNTEPAEWQEETTWHNIVTWDAKFIERYSEHLIKGRGVLVIGRIVKRQYQDKNGHTRDIIEILADSIRLLMGALPPEQKNGLPATRPDANRGRVRQREGGAPQQQRAQAAAPAQFDDTPAQDDVPF
jgi:single-strand DNA-binding protein